MVSLALVPMVVQITSKKLTLAVGVTGDIDMVSTRSAPILLSALLARGRLSKTASPAGGAAVTVFTQGGGLRSPLIDRDVDPPLVPAPAPRLHGAALAHGFLISRPTTTTPFSFSPSGLLASPSAFGFSAQAILICDAVVVVAGCESQLVV